MVTIRYQPNGEPWIYRRYPLSRDDENLKHIYEKIAVLEMDEENYLKNTFGEDYANITTFLGGNLDAFFIDPEDREKEDFYPTSNYANVSLSEKQVEELFYAAIADVKAGTLMKYNISDGKYMYADGGYPEDVIMEYKGSSDVQISFEYMLPKADANLDANGPVKEDGYTVDSDYYDRTRYVYLTIGPDCENVINKLIELEVIESAKHLWWGAAEVLLK